jgi:hypothetical protein
MATTFARGGVRKRLLLSVVKYKLIQRLTFYFLFGTYLHTMLPFSFPVSGTLHIASRDPSTLL